MKIFTDESLLQIQNYIQNCQDDEVSFQILNPDYGLEHYSGKKIAIDNQNFIYRNYETYMDLANFLRFKFCTPTIDKHLVTLRFKKPKSNHSFHDCRDSCEDKYGKDSLFAQIDKNSESGFLLWYTQALNLVGVEQRNSILNLGVNSGDELKPIKEIVGAQKFENISLTGIDFCQSAIDCAKKSYPSINFLCDDINNLKDLTLPKFDLIISIGTLQSPNIDFDASLRLLAKDLLNGKGALILGFPNCRWENSQMIYGAKAPNYSYSELSLLFKDITFAKRYLQQQGFRVTITGKHYLFITAYKL